MVPTRRFFHYTHSLEAARSIARTHELIPRESPVPSGIGAPCGYCDSRVNLTTVPPERGSRAIVTATGLVVEPVFGLELLIEDRVPITQLFPEQFPESYQIFTKEPVPVKVTRMYNVERAHKMAKRGRSFIRLGPELSFLSYAT